jgi:uncharacterized membrane protein YhiD involved in acid resistance
MAITLAILPAVVQIVIALVNGNIGAGVAVAGAFSLVRFRSTPGSAHDIALIFLAMAIGLATGMGHLVLAALFFVIMAAVLLVLSATPLAKPAARKRMLRITIPETLDYDSVFDDIFAQYCDKVELVKVKTTNMGELFQLDYEIELKGSEVPKAFLDDLRCRNANLGISCSRVLDTDEL